MKSWLMTTQGYYLTDVKFSDFRYKIKKLAKNCRRVEAEVGEYLVCANDLGETELIIIHYTMYFSVYVKTSLYDSDLCELKIEEITDVFKHEFKLAGDMTSFTFLDRIDEFQFV